MTSITRNFFPGEVKPGPYEAQIEKDGVQSSFHAGAIFRHPGIVPLLEVSGSHFEMGLQYGVLLRPEILDTLAAYERIINGTTVIMGLPRKTFDEKWQLFVRDIRARIPQRFLDEAQGISQGSGVSVDCVLAMTFAYDFLMAGSCTSVLMRAENGAIIHARNNDTSGFGGVELGRVTAVVRRQPVGFHATTQIDYPMLLGIESGYNDQGLAFTEETLRLRQPDPGCFSINILVRMILEECSTLEELPAYFDRYPVLSGYGEVWSSQRQGCGWLVEQTPYGWTKRELQGNILWDFNTIYSPELKAYEKIDKTLRNDDDREAVARAFPRKESYTIQDGIDFLRASHDGVHDHIHFGSRRGICNAGTQQSMVFDPQGQGIYLSWGDQYCSLANFYHVFEDFSLPPAVFSPQTPISEKMVKMCDVSFQLIPPAEKMEGYVLLAGEYPEDADFQFQVAYLAFNTQKRELFMPYAEKAYQLQPGVAEYRLYAGIAAFWRGEQEIAIQRLETFAAGELFLVEELYRLTILEKISPETSRVRSDLESILVSEDVASYYQEKVVPLILAGKPGAET